MKVSAALSLAGRYHITGMADGCLCAVTPRLECDALRKLKTHNGFRCRAGRYLITGVADGRL
jgi:hypothetical protein